MAILGIDEVGRGPWAGPLVVGACLLPETIEGLNDSKKLSEKRREDVYRRILDTALFVGVGQADPEEIDRINILQATKNAMRRAAAGAPATLFLIDAVDSRMEIYRETYDTMEPDTFSPRIFALEKKVFRHA